MDENVAPPPDSSSTPPPAVKPEQSSPSEPTPAPKSSEESQPTESTVPEPTLGSTPEPKPDLNSKPTPTPVSATGKKILLIDDDTSFLELYSTVFSSAGFNYLVAQNGPEALEKAKTQRPDLILLDIMMPDTNGLEILKRLKQDPATANINVWMITNLAEQIDQETAASLGATDYLVKSTFTPKQVCEKINAFFGNSQPGLQTAGG